METRVCQPQPLSFDRSGGRVAQGKLGASFQLAGDEEFKWRTALSKSKAESVQKP